MGYCHENYEFSIHHYRPALVATSGFLALLDHSALNKNVGKQVHQRSLTSNIDAIRRQMTA